MTKTREVLKAFLARFLPGVKGIMHSEESGKSLDPVRHLIETAYGLILDRNPDPDGLALYYEKISAGKINKAQFLRGLFNSQEFEQRNPFLPLHAFFANRFPAGKRERFTSFVQKKPFAAVQINELTNPYKWLDPDWRKFGDDLLVVPMGLNQMHRKAFEWIQTLYGLSVTGKLCEKSRVLGVGTGHEPIVYWLARNAGEVMATDLFDEEWAQGNASEGDPSVLSDPDKYKPFDYPRERLKFIRMDGRSLEFDDNSFDIVFSLSAIEHFGGKELSGQAVKEMARVLKNGGMAVIATEYVLNSIEHPAFFNEDDLLFYIIQESGLNLIQDIDFSVPHIYLDRPLRFPEEIYYTPHMSLTDGNVVWTSIVLFLVKSP